jgi:hypothetical protein
MAGVKAKLVRVSERLLSVDLVSQRLGVTPSTVRRHMYELITSGLQRVPIGDGTRLIRFREDSLNRMIKRAAERGEPLIKKDVRSGQGVKVPVST